jgi:hypothetical protein
MTNSGYRLPDRPRSTQRPDVDKLRERLAKGREQESKKGGK